MKFELEFNDILVVTSHLHTPHSIVQFVTQYIFPEQDLPLQSNLINLQC